MFEVVPWPTPTSATTEATPMMTPSIVSAARRRLVRRRESARRSSSRRLMPRPARRAGGSGGRRPARSPASWVMRTIVRPAAFSSWRRSMTSAPARLSRLPVGSSARISAGSVTIARATATRCCWPPDSSVGSCVEAVAEAEPLERGLAPARRASRARRPGRGAASRRCRAPTSAAAGCTTGRRTRWSGCAAGPARRRRAVLDRRAGEPVLAGGRPVQAAEDVHHRALAGARRPDDRDELAGHAPAGSRRRARARRRGPSGRRG